MPLASLFLSTLSLPLLSPLTCSPLSQAHGAAMPDAARAAQLLVDAEEPLSVFPHRTAWAPCSLAAATDADPIGNACRLRSLLGTGASGW